MIDYGIEIRATRHNPADDHWSGKRTYATFDQIPEGALSTIQWDALVDALSKRSFELFSKTVQKPEPNELSMLTVNIKISVNESLNRAYELRGTAISNLTIPATSNFPKALVSSLAALAKIEYETNDANLQATQEE